MIMMLFVISLTLFLFSSFTLSYRLQTINRVVINTPISIFESSISLLHYIEEHNLYFDKEALRKNLINYYDENLEKVFKDYEMTLYFYNQESQSICVSDQCDAVKVTISGNIFFQMEINRSVNYEIHKGAKYAG